LSSAEATVVPEALLGLPVRHRQLRLGTVSAVLVSADDAVLGMVVASSWGGPEKVLPLPAAFVTADGIESTPLALLSEADAAFYERRGARRVCREVHGAKRGLNVA
jgi:hypothetical protein